MKRSLPTLAALCLAGAVALGGVQSLLAALWPTPFELQRVPVRRLDERTRARLESLDGEVLATYVTSPRAAMPSEMRRLEAEVTGLLERMRRASGGRFDWTRVHPEERPELSGWLARQGIAPFRARTVRRDAWSEREVYSTLRLAYAGRGIATIDHLSPDHLPVLAELVRAHLDELESPSAPRVVVAGPHTGRLVTLCRAAGADVREVDFDGTAELPDADLFFWVAPSAAGEAHRRGLEHFIEKGGSAVVAGSDVRLELVRAPDVPPAVRRLFGPAVVARALAPLGLSATPGTLMDENNGQLVVGGEALPAPWRVRCPATQQDFRGLVGQPNGNLLFDAPTAWRWDPEELDARAVDVHPLATTSARAWVADLTDPVPVRALAPEARTAVARQTLAVLLEPRDPWRGRVVALGSASVLQDEEMGRSSNAHARLASVLLDTLASRERRVLRRAGHRSAPPLPPLSVTARVSWRAAAALALPLVLGLVALARRGARPDSPRAIGVARIALGATLLAFAAGALWRALPLDAVRLDATRARVHTLDAATRALCATAPGPVRAELFFSDPLPPSLEPGRSRLRSELAELRRAGLDLELSLEFPGDAGEERRRELRERGIVPKPFVIRGSDEETVRSLWSTLSLSAQGREVVLDFPAPIAFENLEFRLAAALWNLAHGRAPTVLVAAETPRLSPAEEHVQYRSRGLFAPGGEDAFRLARELLSLDGFEVRTLDPRAPEPIDPNERPDLLVWLQPHRDVGPMMAVLAEHLAAGGAALVAAQHFDVRARQPAREDLAVVHWPQPRFCDLERGWLADLGVVLVRECLFDRVSGRRRERSEIERGKTAALESGETAEPYLVRAVASGYADDPMVARLGDLLFASGSRIALDPERLRAHALSARVLVRASPRAWSYAWEGGNLPADVLDGTGPVQPVPGAPLVVRVEGRFPALEPDAFGPAAARPGRLLLCGDSEMFENDEILDPAYDHAGFLQNAAAALALGPELGGLMARRSVPQGFAPPPESRRLAWRAAVVGLVPALLALAGLARLVGTSRVRRDAA